MIDPIEYAWKKCNPGVPFPVDTNGRFTTSHLLVPESWIESLTNTPGYAIIVADEEKESV